MTLKGVPVKIDARQKSRVFREGTPNMREDESIRNKKGNSYIKNYERTTIF